MGERANIQFIKELIGSSMFYPTVEEYFSFAAEKLAGNTYWKNIIILKYNKVLDIFSVITVIDKSLASLSEFYTYESRPIQKALKEGALARHLRENAEEPFEANLFKQGFKKIVLAPIILKNEFAGLLIGLSKKNNDQLAPLDVKIMELVSEILAVSMEKYKCVNTTEETLVQLQNYQEKMISFESLKLLGDLAAGISHNLNNLLAGILAYTQLVENKQLDQETQKVINQIRSAALVGKETVSSLQEFKKMNVEMEFENVQLTDILNRAIHITRSKWQDEAWAKNIEYKFEMDISRLPLVLGNPSTLLETFIVAIFTILEGMPAGGCINIETYQQEGNPVIRFSSSSRKIIGRGLSVYDPFLEHTRAGEEKVNFQVAKDIIKRHRGRITRENPLGQGAIITIELPAIMQKVEEIKEHFEISEAMEANILVVEDEPMVRALLAEVLLGEGFNLTTVENGEKALQEIEQKEFDLILTDLGMPGMSGFDLAERIRKINPSIPIIMATGWQAQLDTKKVEEYKINHVVGKPFQINELVNTVRTNLKKIKP
ncbi:MAG: response regulator [Vulcanimicrobiota bacterium]